MTHAVVGVVLLLVLLVDVFATVFSPFGRGGPVNHLQNRTIWRMFRAVARRRGGRKRDSWLSLAGPAIVVITLGVWVLWLTVAFALLYYPWIESFLFSPGSLRSRFLEALYFSAYTAATLGLGDMIPDLMALRLVAALEAFGGFALLSVSVTYFLAVYRELVQMRSLASGIATYLERAKPVLTAHPSEAAMESFRRWCEATASRLASVLLAHFQYPVLHYFRSGDPSRALPVQIGTLLELRRTIRSAESGAALASLAESPSYLALEATVEEYVDEVDSLFVPPGVQAPETGAGDATERAHERVLAFMEYR